MANNSNLFSLSNLLLQYNKGLIGGFRQIAAEEGAMALTTGLGATAAGYFVQGWFKFGGVEFFKIQAVKAMGEENAWERKTAACHPACLAGRAGTQSSINDVAKKANPIRLRMPQKRAVARL